MASNNSNIIIDGTTIAATSHGEMLPLRDVAEHLRWTLSWNNSTRAATIRRGNRTITITIDSRNATVNGSAVTLAAPPTIIDGRTMVTLCFFADHMGLGAGHINNAFILSTRPATSIPVLIYHHIIPDAVNTRFTNNAWTISTENFTQQMRHLRDNGFYTPTLDEFEAFLFNGRPLPQRSVMIHFDDGYYSNIVYAYPILQEFGLRAVLFPITERGQVYGDTQPLNDHNGLTWAAVGTLMSLFESGVWETASHSHDMHQHAPCGVATVLAVSSHDEILYDTLLSFEFVTNTRAYAYPLGQYNSTVIGALREAGITMGFTTEHRRITQRSDPFRLGRFTIYRETTMARFRDIVGG